ncbi:MAG: hypothetical protein H7Y37_16940 [Anaerolineae bacterium]|nr:hypothetical protein [Gloeobacterales cyanobacterium ES-bin-313]
MEKRAISAVISEQEIEYLPGGSPVTFEVTVINQGNVPAQFQMEILAAGANQNLKWYKLDPEISTLKPPGSQTKFTVAVIDSPLLGFVGMISATIRIFSPQIKDQHRSVLRLRIGQGKGYGQLIVELPVRQFQVNPREIVDIPVRVRNTGQQSADVILNFLNMPQSWIVGGPERRLIVKPGDQSETTFQCQPPIVKQAPSQLYPFAVEAKPQVGQPGRAEGSLEVLPIGFVEFGCPEPKQSMPAKGGFWWPNFEQNPVEYALFLKNCSNLRQTVSLQVQGKDQPKCNFALTPPQADLDLGNTATFSLTAQKSRPWIGIGQNLNFEAAANLPDQRLGNAEPATIALELRLLPIIPVWMQLALLLLLLALIYFFPRFSNLAEVQKSSVNAVRIRQGNHTVLSASQDHSIRVWSVGSTTLTLQDKPFVLDAGDAVRALRFSAQRNQVAAGLNNGLIRLWNIDTKPYEGSKEFYQKGDTTFDLVFSRSGDYLYSAHGSGLVIRWKLGDSSTDVPTRDHAFKLNDTFKFAVRSIALTDQKLVSVGQNNQIILWDLGNLEARPQRLSGIQGGSGDIISGVALWHNRLVVGSSQGQITIWDLGKCKPTAETIPASTVAGDGVAPINVACPMLDSWYPSSPSWSGPAGSEPPAKDSVNTVFLSEDGSQLLSGGGDHKVTLWTLTADGRRDNKQGQIIDERSSTINTVELGIDDQGLFEVSGDTQELAMKRVVTK